MAIFEPMNNHLARIESFVLNLEASVQQAMEKASITRSFKKGEYLLREGEICRHSFQITKGIVRKYYLNEGKEFTTDLFFAEDLALSLTSYVCQQPSHEFIQAVEDTKAICTSFEVFQNLKKEHTVLVQLDLLLTEYHALWLEQRLWEFYSLNATQRYEKLLKEQPHFVQQLPLTYLASYLGISLETLSRIRAKK
jgi:CRP-like cAMP-binding protein